jgi:von Willebrand factor type A domain
MRSISAAAVVIAGLLFSAPAFAQGVPRCPNLLIVFDVSGSMQSSAPTATGGTAERYIVGRDAVRKLLASNPSQLRFGLELFGDEAAGGLCGISPANCFHPSNGCNSVACGYDTQSDILAVLDGLTDNDVQGNTPTGPAIDVASTRADMNDSERPRYVILLTDGEPNNCGDSSSESMESAVDALNAIRQNLGVKTFVLGFGLQSSSSGKLNQMAEAGGMSRFPGQCNTSDKKCFYEASDAQQLEAALSQIVHVVSGELGGFSCDDSCYAQGCPAGQVCQNSQCAADPCAGVSCGEGSACVEGVCEQFCAQTCVGNQRCENGACVDDSACPGGCTGRNQTCVAGACVEDLCSSQGRTLECPATHICYKNACHLRFKPATPDAGTQADGGSTGAGPQGATGGCCSGAPGSFNVLALAIGLLALRIRRASA